MTTPTSVPPPGWYGAGVTGEERWWDGRTWTEHTRALAVAPAAGTTRLLGFQSATNSLIFAILAAGLGLPIVLFALLMLASGNPLGLVFGLFAAAFAAIAVLMFINFRKMRQQEAAAAAQSLRQG